MLSYYVNVHVESKCYEYYVKKKVTQALGYQAIVADIKIVLICFRQCR